MDINQATSIKELIQGMAPKNMEIIRGIVTQITPLEIVAENDDKLVLNANTAVVPWYLTDYTTKCDIELRGGKINSHTYVDGEHTHPVPTGGGAHRNWLEDFNVYRATIRHYNALKVGETVFILSFNHGKKYFVLDREVDYFEW